MIEQELRVNTVIFRDYFLPYQEKMFELIELAKAKRVCTKWKDIGKNIDAVFQRGEVIIRENYGRAANKVRIFWNPADGVIDFYSDKFNRRMAWRDFISEAVRIHLDQGVYYVERIQRTINRKDPQGTEAVYECMTLVDGAWHKSARLYQSIAASGYDTRGDRLFPFTDFEKTWYPVELDESKPPRPIRTFLTPDEEFFCNGFDWYIQRPNARGFYDLRRVPAWLAEHLPAPPAAH